MRLFNLILSVLIFILCVESKADGNLKNRYDAHVITIVNSKEVKTTSYKQLLAINPNALSDKSKQQLRNTLDIFENPEDKKLKLQFINDFPKDFNTFLSVFHADDFGELYHGSDIYLELLQQLSNEYPKNVVSLLISLSKDAKWSADATGYLQRIVTGFIINHYATFIVHFKKLSTKDQKNISIFLADVETISTYPKYIAILDLFKSNNELSFYKMFLNSKKERIEQGH